MNEHRQNAINHLKTHLGCVGYRDYLIAELEKLEKIEKIVNDCKWGNRFVTAWEQIQRVLEKE